LSRREKAVEKFFRKPVPNDITYDEMERVAKHFGCIVDKKGGKHPYRVVYPKNGTVIPIPVHGKTVKEAYISQLKTLFECIKEEE
jgi:hypothetical protein